VINTGTTMVTLPDGVLIQNTQNRELLDLEELTEADLERLRSRYEGLGRVAREDLLRGMLDDTPDVPVELTVRVAKGRILRLSPASHPLATMSAK
jgi:hypothetical protein